MSNITRTLYGVPSGTTTYMATITAAELGLDVKLHSIDMKARDHKAPEYIAKVHPLGKVPAYTETNEQGETVFNMIESRAIVRYFNSIGNNALTPFTTPQEWARFEQFASFEATTFTPVLVKILIERLYAPMFGRQPNEEAVVKAVEEIRPLLKYLDDNLKTTNEYMLGKFSLADIFFFAFVHSFYVNCQAERKVFQEFSALDAWHTRVAERPHVQKIISSLF